MRFNQRTIRFPRQGALWLLIALLVLQTACGQLGTQTRNSGEGAKTAPHFKPGFNLFSPEQDVQMGKQSATQVAQQMPLVKDPQIVNFVRALGAKLAARAHGYKFPYQFNVVAVKELNAFALPGGYVFVHAGLIAAAKNEGELAGVLAHEITHVALRHGTNQASKAYLAQAGLEALGSLAGGQNSDMGQVIAAIGGAGANVAFLKMSRTAESEADLDGARIVAEAGYDPRDMANFFKTLEAEAGAQGPEFLSDHPNPGNRFDSIIKALPSLPVSANPIHTTNEFEAVKARLTGGKNLSSSSGVRRVGPQGEGEAASRVALPSSTMTSYEARDGAFLFEYPDSWDGLSLDDSNFIFAPKGAYGKLNGAVVVTHGVFIGAMPAQADDLENATRIFIEQQIKANPDFQLAEKIQEVDFGDRRGYAAIVAGPSPVTGTMEVDVIYTTATADGRLFYLITIAPEDEYQNYKSVFEKIIAAIRVA